MQVRVSVGATSLIALLDTGSTHSFIREAAAHRTGLPVQPRSRLTATGQRRESTMPRRPSLRSTHYR
jgi:predicted aspartyl protease